MPRPRRTKPPADAAQPAFPCTVVIDTREQSPYSFDRIPADVSQGGGIRTEVIQTSNGPVELKFQKAWLAIRTEVRTLKSGDYSLAGYEHRVAVERKSPSDCFSTIGQGRDRFERELARLNGMQFAAVVVESEWSEIFADPPEHSQLSPKTVYRSVLAWQQRFKNVHWLMVPGREVAEVTTFRVLERFWKERVKEAGAGMVSVAVNVPLVIDQPNEDAGQ